jgi:hypothetical protein
MSGGEKEFEDGLFLHQWTIFAPGGLFLHQLPEFSLFLVLVG